MTENSFQSNSLLYYPSIEFKNETWVKATLTFWDEIYRIVPPYYKPKDSDEIKIAVSEGFIKNIELNEKDLNDTAEKFMQFCDTLEFHPDGFETSKYEVRLHTEKIDSRLKPLFQSLSTKFNKDGFFILPPEVVNGYMFFLSTTVSQRRNIPKLTDNPDMFAAMSYFDGGGNFDEFLVNEEATEIYANLMIQNLIPADIRSISMNNILKRSNDLKNNKRDFRNCVSGFAEKLNRIEDIDFAKKEIAIFKSELLERQNTRKEILSQFSKNLQPSVLYVGFPTLMATLAKTMFSGGDVFDIKAIASGLFVAGIASLTTSGKKLSSEWNGSKSNYYLDVRKDLVSKDESTIIIDRMTNRLNEYVND